ncbi:XrtA system polysaccharide chain length determinant [Piscinibacter sp.]|uniref:XrtA system polysaccharide chain length determinant n=1 Tax=Piscinibacter sp. TaxID=1903157 RepID=UPI002B8FD683|nr:XrtA system polysaccharide chain length determinant [Albitalea sp.]HUG25782.1 XrtA system polysaccharide chain length determinant [Albitalea sp.]
MEQLIQQALDLGRSMWRRRWYGLLVAWLVGVAGALALMLVANRYEASARVYVDTKTVLRPLMRDLTVEPDMDQTVGMLARTLITRPNVELLLRKTGLAAEAQSPAKRDRMVETLLREIKVAGVGRDNVFKFTYRDVHPDRARLVVQHLVTMFLESDTGAKRRDAEAARGFIDEQIKSYEQRLADSENRLKEFKLRNLGMADSGGKDYFARISTLTEELSKLTVEMHAAEQARDALRHALSGETMSLLPDVLPATTTPQVSEYNARLDSQRKQLDDLLRRFTDLHPDVVATRRLIERLEEERQREIDAHRRALESNPVPATSQASPMMQQVRLALAEAEANVASIRVRLRDTQARLGQLRASASRVPQIEAELAQLNRDYDVVRRTYETMVARREKASLSEDVDATRSAQFRVIDPPRTSPQPVFPNRVALAPLVLLAALAAGVATCFAFVQLLPTFDNSRVLRNATQRPVLGSVSMVMNDDILRRARHGMLAFITTFGGFFVVAGVWIAWISMQARG